MTPGVARGFSEAADAKIEVGLLMLRDCKNDQKQVDVNGFIIQTEPAQHT